MISVVEQIALFFIALISNALSALAGGGAGLLQLPALIFLGLPFPVALATHKIATVALGAGATIKHARSGNTQLTFALFMLAVGLPGVVLGANYILEVPPHIAQFALGILTIGLGIYSIYKKQLGHKHEPSKNKSPVGYLVGGCVLFILGVLNGSLTSGTGLFVTVWLIMWFGFDFRHAIAHTVVMVGLFWNGTGALTLALQSPVKWDWLPGLIVGSLIGGYLGAHFANIYGNKLIKRIFESVTILVGAALLMKASHS